MRQAIQAEEIALQVAEDEHFSQVRVQNQKKKISL
jgi:hypothetical protein